ncbi:MAG: hypothetical protein RLZZ136_77 [Pseudomonadota bacterium]|jgi:uncharacterized iron-regulated membrane protein
MRKWHRWLSVTFGVFLLWIAVTGVLSQIQPLSELVAGGEAKEAKAEMAQPAGFVCPPDYTCRPKQKPGGLKALTSLFHHLHSGESFGPAGVIVATLSGLAMVFFSFSGLWMYIMMWRNRAARSLKPRWFWK